MQYLMPDMSPDIYSATGNVVAHCPTDQYLRSVVDRGSASGYFESGLIGYFYLPGQRPPHSQVSWQPGIRQWATKRQFDGPYADAPITADHYQRDPNGRLWQDGNSDIPTASHVTGRSTDDPLGSNLLFEDASVSWRNVQEIEHGATHTGNSYLQFLRIHVPGLASQ
ncbi:MAG: hypothetical protein WD294_14835 [Phycisphaeraceae bacterium]